MNAIAPEEPRRHPEARHVWAPAPPYLRRTQLRAMPALIAAVRHTKGEDL